MMSAMMAHPDTALDPIAEARPEASPAKAHLMERRTSRWRSARPAPLSKAARRRLCVLTLFGWVQRASPRTNILVFASSAGYR